MTVTVTDAGYTFAPFGVDWEKQAPLFDGYRARFLGAAGVTSA